MSWTNDRQTFSSISATTSTFVLKGGRYAVQVSATFGGGSVKLDRLSLDGSTYGTVSTYTAATYEVVDLPPGTYRLTIATATAIYAEVVAIAVTGP